VHLITVSIIENRNCPTNLIKAWLFG